MDSPKRKGWLLAGMGEFRDKFVAIPRYRGMKYRGFRGKFCRFRDNAAANYIDFVAIPRQNLLVIRSHFYLVM